MTAYVCEEKDHECGSNPASWCSVCPMHNLCVRGGDRYELKLSEYGGWRVVTKEEYVEVERICGFRSKTPGEPATGAFGVGFVQGRVLRISI